MATEILLRCGAGEATLSSLGAELMSWRVDGRELIWNGDARWWPRRAPTLFPLNGWTNGGRIRVDGREYPCGVHGFGRDTEFEMRQTGEASASLTLTDTPRTRAEFPFAFRLTADVALTDRGFSFSYRVGNTGRETLPYSLGFHPGFLWPFDGGRKEEYVVEFSEEERHVTPRIIPGGLFTAEPLAIPMQGRRLAVAEALALQESICFIGSKSQRVDFVAPGGRRIIIESENFPNWVLWSKADGAYLCIERWTGLGDPAGFEGDIREKPGMILLPPGEERAHAFQCRIT